MILAIKIPHLTCRTPRKRSSSQKPAQREINKRSKSLLSANRGCISCIAIFLRDLKAKNPLALSEIDEAKNRAKGIAQRVPHKISVL
ncbi:MAG: hypothetical protein L3V56_12590 [Candidatus Magnetoovum sp. WYHC-5]|nr:hypothetical protein [Candidatus Magnetoovum sp. WYHC-5]